VNALESSAPGGEPGTLDQKGDSQGERSTLEDPQVAIDEVISYRRAARRVVRGPGDKDSKTGAICQLVQRAVAEAALSDWCVDVVLREYWHDWTEPPSSSDPVIIAIRTLLSQGRSCCPTCRRPLPSEITLQQWQDRMTRSMLQFSLFERAI